MLDANWNVVQVFLQCQSKWITGMHRPIYTGISSLELHAACQLLQIPAAELPEITAGIRVMTETTAKIHKAP